MIQSNSNNINNNQSNQRILREIIDVRLCVKFKPRVIEAIVNSLPIFTTLFSNGTTRYSTYCIGCIKAIFKDIPLIFIASFIAADSSLIVGKNLNITAIGIVIFLDNFIRSNPVINTSICVVLKINSPLQVKVKNVL